MRTFLILLNIGCWSGAIISTAHFMKSGSSSAVASLVILGFVSICCAAYLYRIAKFSKVEWALFGLVGNFSAFAIYFLFGRHKK